ncbi:hypothetical protein K443DRAFT_624780 [Laccaria amethystina LaAM-08-1]|uniref:Uncharacterized protein n=1 Tax=Laccaria amethystina LaAM-08-1 TaxID=1095629 RepID=A0A0C9WKI4_9AGAR|nr:hypothetical protein K443DRAFT_624780 [Laccaria amethystina LaAM-08-1]
MGAGQVMWRLGRVIEGIRRATFGPRRSKKNTLSSRSSDLERNPWAVKAVSRQFTAVVALEGSRHREYTGCGSRKQGGVGILKKVLGSNFFFQHQEVDLPTT